MVETWLIEWWSITVQTYTLIWPALPFAIAFGLWRGWRRNRRQP